MENELDNLVQIYTKFSKDRDKTMKKKASKFLPHLKELNLDSREAHSLMKHYHDYGQSNFLIQYTIREFNNLSD